MSFVTKLRELNPFGRDAYDFEFTQMDGLPLKLSDFRDRPILIVNIASLCVLSPQLDALEELFQAYEGQGLVVIGVPSNDFANQEPKSNDEIVDFCEARFGVTFHLVQKEHVIGLRAHPFYKWVFSQRGVFGIPTWNFHKVLIKPNGRVAYSIPPFVAPSSRFFKAAVERTIAA